MLLDGGLATELENLGHDLDDRLWSAKVLLDNPDDIESAHLRYLESGADCITTATYQATHDGLMRRGLATGDVERVLLQAVQLATRARARFLGGSTALLGGQQRFPLVAASVGPYGAFLADGSEYRGCYGITERELRDFHRPRWRILAGSQADVILAESIPCLDEAHALLALAHEGGGEKPVWFSFTCRDNIHLSDGTPIDLVARWARDEPRVAAVGVNCTRREWIPGLVRVLADQALCPVLAYPNGGGAYDPATKRWTGEDAHIDWGKECVRWIKAGADAVGGCCRIGPADIQRMRLVLDSHGVEETGALSDGR